MSRELSKLEQVFEFEDAAFGEYMVLDGSKASPGKLMRLSAQMDTQTHPIVRYAAGSAAAEAGLFRTPPSITRKKGYPFVARQEALAEAQSHWEGVDGIFREYQEEATTPRRAADLWQFGMRAQLALAYGPSMQVVANWFGGQEPDPDYLEANLKSTTEMVVKIGSAVLGKGFEKPKFTEVRYGLGYEIAAGLLLQNVRLLRCVVVPSSIRQDNHIDKHKRSDLIAVSAKGSHPRAMVQVIGHKENEEKIRKDRFAILVRQDLVLAPKYAPIKTLKELIKREEGESQDPAIGERLEEMSHALVDRLDGSPLSPDTP